MKIRKYKPTRKGKAFMLSAFFNEWNRFSEKKKGAIVHLLNSWFNASNVGALAVPEMVGMYGKDRPAATKIIRRFASSDEIQVWVDFIWGLEQSGVLHWNKQGYYEVVDKPEIYQDAVTSAAKQAGLARFQFPTW